MKRIFIVSPDKDEVMGRILPAIQAAEAALAGYTISADRLADKLTALAPDLVIMRADIARRGEEVQFFQTLSSIPMVIVLPKARAGLRDSLAALPNVRTVVMLPDVDYAKLIASNLGTPSAKPSSPPGQLMANTQLDQATPAIGAISVARPSGRRRAQCLCFAGVKGGVGTTTSMCALAIAAAALKMRVGVVDLTGTGDLQATLPKGGLAEILDIGRADLVSSWPRLKAEYDLVLVDAGRFPLPSLSPVSVVTVAVTRADTTDRLPAHVNQVVISQADRAPVGLKTLAVLPVQEDLYAQLAERHFLQPGPLLEAATAWAKIIQREVH